MENKSTKNYVTLFFITYLIGNTSIIDKNTNKYKKFNFIFIIKYYKYINID